MRSLFCIASLVILPAACSGGGEDIIPPEGELEVGSALIDGTGFVDVEDGADVELVPGAQGGFHVWLNIRVHGAEGRLYIHREARRVMDDQLVLRGLRQAIDVPSDAMVDWWESPDAAPAFMCPSPVGLKVFDQEIYYDVVLKNADDDEIVAEDTVILTPHCPEGDQHDFCVDICSG